MARQKMKHRIMPQSSAAPHAVGNIKASRGGTTGDFKGYGKKTTGKKVNLESAGGPEDLAPETRSRTKFGKK